MPYYIHFWTCACQILIYIGMDKKIAREVITNIGSLFIQNIQSISHNRLSLKYKHMHVGIQQSNGDGVLSVWYYFHYSCDMSTVRKRSLTDLLRWLVGWLVGGQTCWRTDSQSDWLAGFFFLFPFRLDDALNQGGSQSGGRVNESLLFRRMLSFSSVHRRRQSTSYCSPSSSSSILPSFVRSARLSFSSLSSQASFFSFPPLWL